MRINFEILDIRVFLAVYDLRNFHQAAEAVGLSQPALSRRIQALEQVLGAPLLERSRRAVTPTAVGRQIEPQMRRILDDIENSILSSGELALKQHGKITIASIPTAAISFLPKVINDFNQKYPNIRFRILDLSSMEGLDSIAQGDVDFGINIVGQSHPELINTLIMDDPFILYCRADHPLAMRDKVSWDDLSETRLIGVSRESGNRIVLEHALAQSRKQIQWFYEVNHVSTAIGLVEAGLGASVLPRLSLPIKSHPDLKAIVIENPVVMRSLGLLEKRGGHLRVEARKFKEDLLERWAVNNRP